VSVVPEQRHPSSDLACKDRTGVNVITEYVSVTQVLTDLFMATSERLQSRSRSNHLVLSPTGIKQMCDIVRDAMHGITLLDAIGNHVQIPMEWCRTYSVCHPSSVPGIFSLIDIQMLEDMVRLYFNHQKPPGAAFVRRGNYRLVHGGVGAIVEPARWTYDVKPGHTVEMSMILCELNERSVKCPRCRTPFNGQAGNGWADWKVSQISVTELPLMYFVAHLVQDDFKLKLGK
jgi:hypothetical protein